MHHPFRQLLIGGFSLTSLVEALNANNLAAVAAAIAAIATTLWGTLRQERRRDFDQVEYMKMARALVDAKVKAVKAGKEDPFPHLSTPGFPVQDKESREQKDQ